MEKLAPRGPEHTQHHLKKRPDGSAVGTALSTGPLRGLTL